MKQMNWDEYYMANAFLAALRSKDPVTKVGACIVNKDKKIVGIGYNGFPIGCMDDKFPWTKDNADPLESKYLYVCHAEVNAILNKNSADVVDCCIYVALFPCNECAKMIIQSRIAKVIYYSDKHRAKPSTIASKKMLNAARVSFHRFVPCTLNGPIDLDFFDSNLIAKLQKKKPKELVKPKKSEKKKPKGFVKPKHLCWTDYFMATAILASYKSRIANKKMGACIINEENKIVGIGYYGLPINCNYEDFPCPTASDEELYFCHAEMNAIANKNCESVKNCTIYVTQFPCNDCAKILIQSGIKRIFYLRQENFDSVNAKAARKMFDAVEIEYTQYEMKTKKIVIDFSVIDNEINNF